MTRTLAFALLAASFAEAGNLTWDTTFGDGAAITHGGGTWSLSNAFWNNGFGNVAWTNTTPRNNAGFAGNASGVTTVTIGSDSVQAGIITINGAGGTMVLGGTYANLSADLLEVKTSAAGKLAINSSGTLTNVAAVAIANGATVYIANATVNSAVTLSGQGNTENLGAIRLDNNGTLQGSISLLGDATFGSNSGTGIIAAAITGNFAFNRSSAGNGTVRLAGNNSHSGGTTVSRGVVQAGHNNAFGTGTLTLTGGTLSSDSTIARTFANAVTLGAAVTLGHATQSGKLTFAGPAAASSAATLTAASAVEFAEIRAAAGIQCAGAGAFTLGRFTALGSAAALAGGTITLPAAGGVIDTAGFDVLVTAKLSGGPLVKTGTGTLTLEQAPPDFTGITTVAQGTLHLKGQTGLPANLKIMPLGDSITYGSAGGYRYPLYQQLLAIAPGFQFIGDSSLNPGSLPVGYQLHAGHSSYSTDDIRKNLDGLDFATFSTYGSDGRDPHGGHWLTGLSSALTYTVPNRGTFTYGPRAPLHPDVILLLVGANDLYRAGSTNGDHRANYTALLNEIYRLRPAAHVFAAQITPHGTNDAPAVAFNTIVGEVVAGFQAAGKPITLVDLHTGYTGGLPDNLHPDATGYAWIAGKWRDALAATLSTESRLSLRSSPAVQVAAGATLSGNALVSQLAVAGILAPGAAQIGTLTASSATLPGTYQCQIDGASCDRLVVEGNLDLTGSTLALTANAPAGRAHVIATYGGALTGNFATITGLPDGFEFYHDAPRKRIMVGRPYDVWRASRNLPDATTGAIPDADTDGGNDLIEFIAGSDPSDPASRPASATGCQEGPQGGRLLLHTVSLPAGTVFAAAGDGSLTAIARGVTLRVQGSRDLINWNQPVAQVTPESGLPALPAGWEYQAFSLPADGGASQGFLRLTTTLTAALFNE
jgi:autotransporter-associated beta strand protein